MGTDQNQVGTELIHEIGADMNVEAVHLFDNEARLQDVGTGNERAIGA